MKLNLGEMYLTIFKMEDEKSFKILHKYYIKKKKNTIIPLRDSPNDLSLMAYKFMDFSLGLFLLSGKEE
jgi:hypothetical protein